MTLAERLQSERRRVGMSQLELATIGGVRPNAQGHYESGLRVPRADYLLSLYRNGIDAGFILMGVRASVPTCQASEHEFIQQLRMLREEDRQALEHILKLIAERSSLT